jgi:integrase
MLSEAVNRHIELYRTMGFKYKVQAYMLHSFAAFAESRAERFIQTDTVLVPPIDVFGHAPRRRRTCHIFTHGEIDRLLHTAAQLTSRRSIQPVTFRAILSLIASTGLRVSEALKLQLSDITEDGLLIRATKFQKSRLVPLHATARHGLEQYLSIRERMKTTATAVFVSKRGTAIPYPTMNQTFLHLARSAGLRPGPGAWRLPLSGPTSSCRLPDHADFWHGAPVWRRSRRVRIRHNQRLSRNASSWSSGRYRPGLTPRDGVRESAFSFNFMSACR